MATTESAFDSHIEQWRTEQTTPWHRMRYRQTAANLFKHLPQRKLRILDAGGGNGVDSVPLAEQGHAVTIADYSQEMLEDARQRVAAAGVQERVHLHHVDVQEISGVFAVECFDLVLCHNVLQYVEAAPALLRDLGSLAAPGGLLSLVSINRFSDVYAAAFLRQDLSAALAGIDAHTMHSNLFDTSLTICSAEEACDLLEAAGWTVEQTYGLLCITSYWGDNERKRDPAIYAQLEQLELALTDKEPYKRLARYYQVIARKR